MSADSIAREARTAITPADLARQVSIGYAGHGSDGVMRRLMLDTTTGQIVEVWARTIEVDGASLVDEVGDEWAYSPDKFLPANERTAA